MMTAPHVSIPSVLLNAEGRPRFIIPASALVSDADEMRRQELEGGIDAEIRLFLDAQLEAHDCLVDCAPGAGFIALTASTHESSPRVVVGASDDESLVALRESARENGVDMAVRPLHEVWALARTDELHQLTTGDGRLFVHVDAATLLNNTASVQAYTSARPFTGLLVTVAPDVAVNTWRALHDHLRGSGLEPCILADSDDGPILLPMNADAPATAIIALSGAVSDSTSADTAATVAATAFASPPITRPFHFIAPFCRTGYGIAGANLLKALAELDADVAFFPLGGVDRSVADFPQLPQMLRRQDDYVGTAPSVRLSQQFDLAMHVGRGPRIGFPIFEIDRFTPRELHHLAQQDHLLVCTDWARDVIRENGIEVPVSVVPLGVDRLIFNERVRPLSTSNDTVFVQVGKIEPRKGQQDLLRAFEAAFSPRDAVRLRLYCHNPFVSEAELAALLAPFRRSPMASRIDLITSPLASQHEVARAMMAADCGVFCSRAEGWNLEALEMLSLGKPVIATAYSAHTAFLNDANARLVPVTAKEARGAGRWAAFGDRELEALVTHLRAVHEARRAGPLPVNDAGIRTATHLSWRAAASALLHAVHVVPA